MKKSGTGGVRMTRRGFQETKEPLSGDVYVVGRSPRHRGVPELVNAAADASREGKAAADDGSGKPAGGDATTSVATAAVRETCAEVADSMAKNAKGTPKYSREQESKPAATPRHGGNEKKPRSTEALWDEKVALDGGPALPNSGREYVEAVNAIIDLVTLAKIQLKSPDEKLSGRLLEQLLKIAYEGADEAPKDAGQNSGWNPPRPERD